MLPYRQKAHGDKGIFGFQNFIPERLQDLCYRITDSGVIVDHQGFDISGSVFCATAEFPPSAFLP
jgi:hypothetical protein